MASARTTTTRGSRRRNVSKCRIDTIVREKLLNVMGWFGSNRPTDVMVAEANEEMAACSFHPPRRPNV
jgi:hypothetical protein